MSDKEILAPSPADAPAASPNGGAGRDLVSLNMSVPIGADEETRPQRLEAETPPTITVGNSGLTVDDIIAGSLQASPEDENAEEDAAPSPAGGGENARGEIAESGGGIRTPEENGSPVPAEENLPARPDEESGEEPEEGEEEENQEEEEEGMTLRDHLRELRKRAVRSALALVVGFFACFSFVEPLHYYIFLPLIKVLPPGSEIQYIGMPDGFLVRVKIAFISGLFAVSPYIFYQIWSFISPGLYKEEKRFILPVAFFSALCFTGGAAFCYFLVFPLAFEFFMGFSSGVFKAIPSAPQYLDFSLQLIVAFGLIFEMPLFTFFLARMGLVTSKMLSSVRRYAVVGIFIVAAILTPPDIYSQMLMAMPMLLLYELSILVAFIFGKKKPEKNAAEGEEAEEEQADPADPASQGN